MLVRDRLNRLIQALRILNVLLAVMKGTAESLRPPRGLIPVFIGVLLAIEAVN